MNKFDEKIDGLIFSIGVSSAIIGITYFSKLYYFYLNEIPLNFLSFTSDDFTKFSIIPIILVCTFIAALFYTRFSLGKSVSTNNWIANSVIELALWILIFTSSFFFRKIENNAFMLLDTACSILMWIHGSSFLNSIVMGVSKKAKLFYAEALALKAEAEFLKEENERLMNNTNTSSGTNLTIEDRKQLHKNRVEIIKTRFRIENSIEKTKGMIAELFCDFARLTKYAKFLTIFLIVLSLNCNLIKKEIARKPNRFAANIKILSDKKELDGFKSVIYSDQNYIYIADNKVIQIFNISDIKLMQIDLKKEKETNPPH